MFAFAVALHEKNHQNAKWRYYGDGVLNDEKMASWLPFHVVICAKTVISHQTPLSLFTT